MLAKVNGAAIEFDDAGTGPAVVFIHAGIADRSMWDAQVDRFSKTHRVIRWDLRGFGESPPPETSFSNVEDARALLDVLNVGQAVMVGISMGGEVALDFTLEYPARVARLVLVSTLAAMEEPSEQLRANWGAAEAAFERGDLDGATEIELNGWIIGAGRSPEVVGQIYRTRAARMIRAIWERAATMDPDVEAVGLESPRLDRLGEVAVPTLLVRGDHDFPDVTSSVNRLHDEIAGARTVVIPNTAHLPPLEHPDQFNEVLREFLDEH